MKSSAVSASVSNRTTTHPKTIGTHRFSPTAEKNALYAFSKKSQTQAILSADSYVDKDILFEMESPFQETTFNFNPIRDAYWRCRLSLFTASDYEV